MSGKIEMKYFVKSYAVELQSMEGKRAYSFVGMWNIML